jgi:hypothetical protein
MSFESELRTHLLADTAIGDLVGERVRPDILPESSALPAITYFHIAGEPQTSIDGFTSNLTRYLIQIDCWALLYSQVVALALAVRNRLKTNAATIKFHIAAYPLIDDYEPETKRYRRALEIACWHEE